jgi:predicted HicB family RNase H-like nuclease
MKEQNIMITKEYKGFIGEYKFISEDIVYFGKISNTVDLVTFESNDRLTIQKAFEEAVDDYIKLREDIK